MEEINFTLCEIDLKPFREAGLRRGGQNGMGHLVGLAVNRG